jgi:hypothetical protein
MRQLAQLAQKYHDRAERTIRRHTSEEGVFDAKFQPAVDYFRNSSAAVQNLVDEDGATGTLWSLEGDQPTLMGNIKGLKVTAADKAATPQELLAKATR